MSVVLIHSYSRKTGEAVRVTLVDNAGLYVAVDGVTIHGETGLRRTAKYTERAAKKRALQYEQQDHDDYNRIVASNTAAS